MLIFSRIRSKIVRDIAARVADKHESPIEVIEHAISYLQNYGYLPEKVTNLVEVGRAIKRFEEFLGLTPGGKVTPELAAIMARPRCGCRDIQSFTAAEKALGANPWAAYGISVVKWGFTDFLEGISQQSQKDMMQAALDHWAAKTGLQHAYTAKVSEAHVQIGLATQRTGSDGKGNMLAYTYLPSQVRPPISMLFDVSEAWTDSPSAFQIWYQQVAEHETGHVFMNLEHSSPSDGITALMDPIYDPRVPTIQAQDVQRGQVTWGPPAAAPAPVSPAAPAPTFPPAASPGQVDTGDRYRVNFARGGSCSFEGLGTISLERLP